MGFIKQNCGVEVDSKLLKVCFKMISVEQESKIKGTKTFKNTAKGFQEFYAWLSKKMDCSLPCHITMEATGVYYENLVYFLEEQTDFVVHVVLPNVAKAFSKSLNQKSKTDKLDAISLASLGLERKLTVWKPFSPLMRELKKVNRERIRLIRQRTMIMNQIHAEQASYRPSKKILSRARAIIKKINQLIEACEKELKEIVEQDPELKERIKNVCTAKGLGFITVVGVIAETNGFILFKNRKQVVSYAGYDVVKHESGSSVRGKERISKKGNSYIRQMMYMPSLSAAVHDEHLKGLYTRIVDRTGIKKKGSVAVQRKLLVLIYHLFTKNEKYDPQYREKARLALQTA
jgi:transposase